jgi:hypothetical protein
MKDAKYVIMDNGLNDAAIVFPNYIEHALIANAMPGHVIAAGFVSFTDSECTCHGSSVSLKIASRPDVDAKIIRKEILRHT